MARWVLGVVTLLALALRVAGLLDQPLWFDEIKTLVRADAATPLGVLHHQLSDCQAPLYDLLTWIVIKLFGRSEWAVRLPAVLVSTALVPATFALARATFDAVAGAIAALLIAVAPVLIAYGQEGRPYSLFALLTAVVLLAATRLVRSRGERGATLLAWSAPLLMLTHYYGVLVLLAVLAHLLLNLGLLRERIGRIVLALLPTLFLGLAWLPVALWQFQGPSGAVVYERPVARDFLASLDSWSLEGAAAFTGATARCTYAFLIFAGVGAALRFARSWRDEESAAGSIGDAPAGAAPVADGNPDDARSLKLAVGALLVAGLLSLAVGAVWPRDAIAAFAARMVHRGEPLDAGGLAFVDSLRRLELAGGGALVGIAAIVALLPKLARRLPRRECDLLLPLAIVLPLAGVTIVDAMGVTTFLPRHSIYAAAPLAALAAGAIAAPAAPSVIVLLCGILVAASARGFRGDRPLRDYPDFRAVNALVQERRELVPVAHPDWSARCIEYYAGRPWQSVAGLDDPEQARRFARAHPSFLFVSSYEGFEDPSALRRAFEETHRVAATVEMKGVRCETWQRR